VETAVSIKREKAGCRYQLTNIFQKSTWMFISGWLLVMMPISYAEQKSQNEAQQKQQPTDSKKTTKKKAPEAQFTAEGIERCVQCHSGESITLIANTVHGNKDNPHTPYAKHGCESCHGPGSLHVSRARGGRGFPLLLAFRPGEPVKRQTEACVGCHAKAMGELNGVQWTGSVHDKMGMTCVNCHTLHSEENPLQDQKQQREVCAKCHSQQISNHRRYENTGIEFDNLTCFKCHDVHQLLRNP
jgi:predicted CXXCH cytochrome family protein